jgi:hypothetical protein
LACSVVPFLVQIILFDIYQSVFETLAMLGSNFFD